jgi:hypothetical protein
VKSLAQLLKPVVVPRKRSVTFRSRFLERMHPIADGIQQGRYQGETPKWLPSSIASIRQCAGVAARRMGPIAICSRLKGRQPFPLAMFAVPAAPDIRHGARGRGIRTHDQTIGKRQAS